VTPGDQLLVAEGAPAMGLPAEQADHHPASSIVSSSARLAV